MIVYFLYFCVCHCTLLKYITLFAVFEFWYVFSDFAENLKVSLSRKRIVLNLEEILVNSLQMVCKMSCVPLNAEFCMQNVKNSNLGPPGAELFWSLRSSYEQIW